MGAISTLANVGFGAVGAADFGKKGMVAGGLIGVGGEFVGSKIAGAVNEDESSVSHQAVKGFVSGSVLSGFSSAQELYAFNNPNSVQALTSINSTTTIGATHDMLSTLTSPSQMRDLFEQAGEATKDITDPTMRRMAKGAMVQGNLSAKLMTPKNFLVDAARQGAIKGTDISDMIQPMLAQVANASSMNSGITTDLSKLNDDVLDNLVKTLGTKSDSEIQTIMASTLATKASSDDMKAFGILSGAASDVAKDGGIPASFDEKEIFERVKTFTEKNKNNPNMAEDVEFLKKYANDNKGKISKDTLKGMAPSKKSASTLKEITQKFKEIEDSNIGIGADDMGSGRSHLNTFFQNEENADLFKRYIKEVQADRGITPKTNKQQAVGAVGELVTDFAKNQYDTIKETVDIADGKSQSPFINNVGASVKEQEVNILGNKVKLKGVDLTDEMSTAERLGYYVERNEELIDQVLPVYNEHIGANMAESDKVTSAKQFREYLAGIEPGAYGTYKEMQRKGVYGDKASVKDKALGFMLEQKNGSPLWARALDKDLNETDPNKKATMEKIFHLEGPDGARRKVNVADGDKLKRIAGESVVDVKNVIKGGNKMRRGLALAGDIAIGGGAMAAMYAVPAMLGKVLSGGNSGNKNVKEDRENSKRVLGGN